MPLAAFATVQLARFDSLRTVAPVAITDQPNTLFCQVGADCRGAATEPSSHSAYTFVVFGLHANEAAANAFLDDALALAPWQAEAREVWRGVLQPFRHKGEANWLDCATPGPVYAPLAPNPGPDAPFLAITSVGWVLDGLDMQRVMTFGAGVSGVRTSMTAVDGLHSQQSFFLPGVLQLDPITVTFWRDNAAVVAFSYGPGVHKDQMARYREENLADRTSFTRFTVLRQEGTWHGSDPLAW